LYAAALYLLLAAEVTAPDTLVVCPHEFRAALAPWVEHRRQQGHQIAIVSPVGRPEKLKATIGRVARSGAIKYLLLIGDVPAERDEMPPNKRATVPTNYISAKINTRWGSEPLIASDLSYGDLDDDGIPDLAVGRIPADDAVEVAVVVGKILRYERTASGAADHRLYVVSGIGGFGAITDALVEAAARQVILQTVPKSFEIQQTSANPASPHCPPGDTFRSCVCKQLSDGGLAWIYLGHGLHTELDRVATSKGKEPILSVEDVPQLRCGDASPLAVLMACYTGAIDAERDCLAEELLLAEGGPVAVIAASRVTMPYGNTVLGYELLRSCFEDKPANLGSILRLAQQRTLQNPPDGPLRPSLDMLAAGLSPPPVDLAAERREHVAMYHLFGDPSLRLRIPRDEARHAGRPSGLAK
jgi:hypothetical protein